MGWVNLLICIILLSVLYHRKGHSISSNNYDNFSFLIPLNITKLYAVE